VSNDTRYDTEDSYRRICVTPVRNEAWIIDPFLAAVKTWASDVIVADQGSTDGTLERLRGTSGVSILINDSPVFDEAHRQRLLLDRARRIPGKRLLIGLDADEVLSANVSTSEEWRQLDNARPGTIVRFRWVNILPGFRWAWVPPEPSAFGFVDDGSEHSGKRIHSPRVPQPDGAPVTDLQEVVVLHFQYVLWERMMSKHRWYQAWEHIKHRQKSALQIFREYRHMFGSWDRSEIHPVRPEWLDGYRRLGIDFQSLKSEPTTWWDVEVLEMLKQYGVEHFRKIDIWDQDWNAVAARAGKTNGDLSDPRSSFEKTAHRLLKATQGRRSNIAVRAFERGLRLAGW
jgi:Glycosyl transferase family 2